MSGDESKFYIFLGCDSLRYVDTNVDIDNINEQYYSKSEDASFRGFKDQNTAWEPGPSNAIITSVENTRDPQEFQKKYKGVVLTYVIEVAEEPKTMKQTHLKNVHLENNGKKQCMRN